MLFFIQLGNDFSTYLPFANTIIHVHIHVVIAILVLFDLTRNSLLTFTCLLNRGRKRVGLAKLAPIIMMNAYDGRFFLAY